MMVQFSFLYDISFFQLYHSTIGTRSEVKNVLPVLVEEIEFLIIRAEEEKLVKYFDKL